jgi:hypothetical protein
MGSEMSCPCGRKQPLEEIAPFNSEEKVTPQSTPSTSSTISEDIKIKSEFEFQNSKLVIFQIDDIEKFFRTPKNFIMKPNKENTVPVRLINN